MPPLFIKFLPDDERGVHGVRINKREFKLKDIGTWKEFLKVFINYTQLSCEIGELDVNDILTEVLPERNREYKKFKETLGWILIGWENHFKNKK